MKKLIWLGAALLTGWLLSRAGGCQSHHTTTTPPATASSPAATPATDTDTVTHAIVMTYNVENLFDTLDDPATDDEEFLPASERQWNTARYYRKINDLANVISRAGPPVLIGLAEIENKRVLNDLTRALHRRTHRTYEYVHYESLYHRGMDVALLYDADAVRILHSNPLKVAVPGEFISRDILHAHLTVRWDSIIDTFDVFVNHWPSRRGGKAQSEPRRLAAAKILANAVNEVTAQHPGTKIIILGDFNDEPEDKSIRAVLGAGKPSGNAALIDLTWPLKENGRGTYRYKQWWNVLDHIIVNRPLLKPEGLYIDSPPRARIIEYDALLEENHKYGGKVPRRTYYGPRYHGGISDHLPLIIKLTPAPSRP